jgi:HTH-type transcriptional regulator/antitoxin HigA
MMKSFDFDKLQEIENNLNININGTSNNNSDDFIDLIYWLDNQKAHLPYSELINRGLIRADNKDADTFKLLSNNITVSSPALFRLGNLKESNLRNTLISTWQAVIEERVKSVIKEIPPFHPETVDMKFISGLLELSIVPNSIKDIKGILQGLGIIFVVEKAFPSLGVDGLVYKNKNGNPILAMSLRYDRYDNFWFTLCHELAHIALHYNQLDKIIIEDLDSADESDIEDEANYFAGMCIVNRRIWRSSNILKNPTEAILYDVSNEARVHPIILAGRLRFQLKNYNLFTDLVNSIKPSEILGL